MGIGVILPEPLFVCSLFLIFYSFVFYFDVFSVPCCDARYDFDIKTMFGSSLPAFLCRGLMSDIRYLLVCLRIVVCFCFVCIRPMS